MSEQQKALKKAENALTVFEPDNEGASIDLVELFYKLLASWKLIVCLAVVCAIVMGIYTTVFVTPMYSATAIIYVLNRDSAIDMTQITLSTALTNDYIKLFSVWEVQEQVISNLDLPYTYKEMGEMLSVKNAANTRLLDITITGPDPEEAAKIANEYATVGSEYIARIMMIDKPTCMSRALPPTIPVSPNRIANIILGFLLGAFVAAAIVVLRVILDDKYKTAEDIRKYTGLVTLAVVPKDEELTSNQKERSGKDARSGRRKE